MLHRLNPPHLEQHYVAYLERHGLSIPSHRPLSDAERRQMADEIAVSGRQEGEAGKFLAEHLASAFRDRGKTDDHLSIGFNQLIRECCAEIERGLEIMGAVLPVPLFVGEFPTGSLNAQVAPVADGALALINTGVFDFIWRVTKLHALCIQKRDPMTGELWPQETPDETIAINLFKDCLSCYLSLGSVQPSHRIPLAGGLRSLILTNLSHECERFVIAHEIGHVVNGDLENGVTHVLTTPYHQISVLAKHQQQELDADLFAARLLLYLVPLDLPPEAHDRPEMKFFKIVNAAASPLFFFALDCVITYAADKLFDPGTTSPITDHPASEVRMEHVRKELRELDLSEPLLNEIDTMAAWVMNTGKAAVDAM